MVINDISYVVVFSTYQELCRLNLMLIEQQFLW